MQPLELKLGSSAGDQQPTTGQNGGKGQNDELTEDVSSTWKTQCLKSCHGKCEPERHKGSQALYGCVNYCLKLQAAAINLDYQEVFRPELNHMHLKDELPTAELESLNFTSPVMSAVDTFQTTDMTPKLSAQDTEPAASAKCIECPKTWSMTSDVHFMSISLALLAMACALLAFIAKKRRTTLFCKEHHYQPLI